jgi:hypothetical protein
MPMSFLQSATIAATLIGTAPGQTETALRPIIEIHSRTTNQDGGPAWTASGDSVFVPGQPATWYVVAGSSHPDDMTVCGGGVSEVGTLEAKLAGHSFVWKLTVLPAKYENGRQTFDLEWARYRRDGGGRPSAQGKATVTLAEGQRQVVDLVHGASSSGNCRAGSTLIELGASVREDPKLAQAILQYDMWLTHRSGRGPDQVRHFVGMGRQGAQVEFAFVPLRFPVPQLVPNQLSYDVITTVLGTLRGRLQADGRIVLSVDTTRRDGLGPRGEGPVAGGGSSGVKRLEVAPAEAVEIELPIARGRSSMPAVAGIAPSPRRGPAPRPTQPVTVADGRVTVEDALFFEGQRTSLVLQVRQVR